MKIVVTEGVECPNCGAQEVANPDAPTKDWVFNIRSYKVCDKDGQWWSQCLRCAVGDHETKGWFCNG